VSLESYTDSIKNTPPLFLTFEGGEGTGKTTQIQKIVELFTNEGIPFIYTREPGGCESADNLRKLLLEGDDDKWDGVSEALLYTAARNEHLRKVVRPAIAAGKWVVCDRFADSTTVYQGDGRGIDREDLLFLHNLVVKNSWPDITVILDIDIETGLQRSADTKGNLFQEDTTAEQRFENLDVSFHKKVREGFLRIAKENPQRCKVVDADGSVDEVHKRILEVITQSVQERVA